MKATPRRLLRIAKKLDREPMPYFGITYRKPKVRRPRRVHSPSVLDTTPERVREIEKELTTPLKD